MDEGTQELRRELLEWEDRFQRTKACLLRVINAFATVVSRHQGLAEGASSLKRLVNSEGDLPIEVIEGELLGLKNRILAEEVPDADEGQEAAPAPGDAVSLAAVCRSLRNVMGSVLEDFYPLNARLQKEAALVRLRCTETVSEAEISRAAREFLGYIRALKGKISEDFRYITNTFLVLLDQVKDLEKVFGKEFGGDTPLKEIEYFEMKINDDVGSIVNSFDVYTTISEVKKVVLTKIESIKQAVSLRKKEEVERARNARRHVEKLQQRIGEAERDARALSRKAEELEMVAMKDGLTGLYNRKAFDLKLEGTLKTFRDTGEAFSLILFDINEFKRINDTLGHVAGDKVLQKVAESLRESFRENDFVARYGGDEFVVIIERLSEEMAGEKVVHFRKNLAKRRFVSHKTGDVRVAVSAGIAVSQEGDTAEAVIERADKAMYASKAGLQASSQ
jgi:diguanylate cyclase (GGDEF)-like protein